MIPRLSLAFMLLLSACMSPQAAKQRQQAQAADDNAQCAQQGLQPGSDAYAKCQLRIKEVRLDERRQATTVIFNPYRGTPDENFLH